jgi:hypothetical protein
VTLLWMCGDTPVASCSRATNCPFLFQQRGLYFGNKTDLSGKKKDGLFMELLKAPLNSGHGFVEWNPSTETAAWE